MPDTQDMPGGARAPSWDALMSAVATEWPAIDRAALAATGGDRDAVVNLVAEATGHTRTLSSRLLRELEQVHGAAPTSGGPLLGRLEEALLKLEARARGISEQVPSELVDAAERRVRQHPLESLLMALGLGLILGLFLGGGRGR